MEELEISFPDGSETLRVTPLDSNYYRLEDSSFVGDVLYGDTIEIERETDGTNRFLRIVSRSGLKVTCCILSADQQNATGLQSFLDLVVELGGNWERAFGGVLIVHLPQSIHIDVENEIRKLTS